MYRAQLKIKVKVKIQKTNLLNLNRKELESFFSEMGEKSFRATQILKWIYHEDIDDFNLMTNLSKDLRAKLSERAEIRLPELEAEHPSKDGSIKWVLRLDNGNHIEAVFIPEPDRGTLCVSSQVGCALNCTFCSTARQGFNRNLTTAEIIGQVIIANRALKLLKNELSENGLSENRGKRPITNVVLMGMGEPLLNFDNVVRAMNLMLDDFGFGLSKRRITLSTAGVVPAIDRLREVSDVSLAVSLHAPTDSLRDQLVPLNEKYPISKLLAACKRYVSGSPRRRITFEYVMLKGINDSKQHAHELVKVLGDVPSKVNLIPFNPFSGADYVCSSKTAIDRFRNILTEAGITTVTRKTRGDDIAAACGQLAGKVQDRTRRQEKIATRSIIKQGAFQQ